MCISFSTDTKYQDQTVQNWILRAILDNNTAVYTRVLVVDSNILLLAACVYSHALVIPKCASDPTYSS